jgi:hypothetical protein
MFECVNNDPEKSLGEEEGCLTDKSFDKEEDIGVDVEEDEEDEEDEDKLVLREEEGKLEEVVGRVFRREDVDLLLCSNLRVGLTCVGTVEEVADNRLGDKEWFRNLGTTFVEFELLDIIESSKLVA